jgi:hypothetical protein
MQQTKTVRFKGWPDVVVSLDEDTAMLTILTSERMVGAINLTPQQPEPEPEVVETAPIAPAEPEANP